MGSFHPHSSMPESLGVMGAEGPTYSSSAVPRNSVCFLGGLAFSPWDPSTHTVLQLRGPPWLSPCPLSIGAQEARSGSYVSARLCRQMQTQLFCCFRHLHPSPSFKEAPVGKTLNHRQALTVTVDFVIWKESQFHAPNMSYTPAVCQASQVQGPCGSRAARRRTQEPVTAGPQAHQPCLCTAGARALSLGLSPDLGAGVALPTSAPRPAARHQATMLQAAHWEQPGHIWSGLWKDTYRNAQYTVPVLGPAGVTVLGDGPGVRL